MRRNTEDKTIERNYQQKWKFLIGEYKLVKQKKHHKFKFLNDFYKAHGTSRQVFNKYYNRYLASDGDIATLLPAKRGARWQFRRPDAETESRVLFERNKGLGRHEVYAILKPELKDKTPSPSGIYNIFKRAGVNVLQKPMKEMKQKIIKSRAGELGHIDCHYLSKDLITNDAKRYYLVCVLDDATRLAWAEVIEDIKSLSVMFSSLKAINFLNYKYAVKFDEIITDNGPEFASPTQKEHHPFERMLLELGIKHRYTKPYRPQTNGKVERFWRTLNEDLIEFTNFDSIEHFKDELAQYLMYYNHIRPHQGLNGKTPEAFNKQFLSTN